MKKIFLLLLLVTVLLGCTPDEAAFKSTVPVSSRLEDRIVESAPPAEALPSEINLDVPFFPQAPDANWELPWQEACEEASVVLAYYYAAKKPLDIDTFRREILAIVDWETEKFGDYKHTTIAQTAQILREYYKYEKITIHENPTVDEMKSALADGAVIIAPFAGKQLGNPFYRNSGPLYHMLVIKGYDEKNFITNDVGTKRGLNFIYKYDMIMRAMHDWHDATIDLGEKVVIIIR